MSLWKPKQVERDEPVVGKKLPDDGGEGQINHGEREATVDLAQRTREPEIGREDGGGVPQ